MKSLKQIVTAALTLGIMLTLTIPMNAQCDTWNDSPKKNYAEEQHVLYRQYLKQEDYDQAFTHWKNVFEIAPSADGQRSFHFTDGRKIYLHKFKNETDQAKKKEYMETIFNLYDKQVECYPKEASMAMGMKGFDMFYEFRTPYPELIKVLEKSVELGGNNTNYVVFQPYATAVVYEFTHERMDALTARNIYLKLNEIADHNIANNKKFGNYYQQGKDAMNGTFAQIENNIFDCDYFKTKLEPGYRADPDNWDLIKDIYNRLLAQGCPESDPLVAEMKVKYDRLVAKENAVRLKDFYQENPGEHGIALNQEGRYEEAIVKFKEAIAKEKSMGDSRENEKLANYYFYIASIEFRKQKKYASAREFARMAAKLKPNWGQPYMLIGDMYASTSNSCGKETWDKQIAVLAAIDKYAYAKSIDSEVSADANRKISKYADFKPEKEEGFMRKVSEGTSVKVGCWIGETVKVRFK